MLQRTLLLTCTLPLAAAAGTPAHAQITLEPVPHWEQLGPLTGAGPGIWDMTASPANPDQVYALTSAGLVASSDRGASWELRYSEREYMSIGEIGVSPTDPDVLLMALVYDQPVLRSVDGGLTWSTPSQPPASWHYDPEFAPSDGNVAYVVTEDQIWRSDDAGEHFTIVLDVAAAGGSAVALGIDPADAQHAYVPVAGVGLFETLDGGVTWSTRTLPDAGSVTTIAVDPSDGQRLMLLQHNRKLVFLSADAGATWTDVTPVSGVHKDTIAFDPTDSLRLYAGVRRRGLAITEDGGVTWALSDAAGLATSGASPRAILPSSVYAGQVIVGYPGGLFRSLDGGATFERRNHGLDAFASVAALAVDPFDPDHLVAATGGSAFASWDAGLTWTESTGIDGLLGYDLQPDQVVSGRFYATDYSGGVWRSDDGGTSFYESFDADNHYLVHLAPHPTIAGRLFATSFGKNLYFSDDGGVTFTEASLPSKWIWSVANSSVDPDLVYAPDGNGLYTSQDGGLSWNLASVSPHGGVRYVHADPVNVDRAYTCSPWWGGACRTDDRGDTWRPLAATLEFSNRVVVPAFDPTLMIANDYRGGTHFSRNGGRTTFFVGRGVRSHMSDFACSATTLYAGSAGDGVFVLRMDP